MKYRAVPVLEYTAAFTTWATVIKLDNALQEILNDSLLHLQTQFPDTEAREIPVYCEAFEQYLQGAARVSDDRKSPHGSLRMLIVKSCLLSRLVYLGEGVRTVPCPKHGGTWSGLSPHRCPHGCDQGCGCLTGWLPNSPQGT